MNGRTRQVIALLACATTMGIPSWAIGVRGSATDPGALRVRIAESLVHDRRVTTTERGFSSSTLTETSETGTVRIDFEMAFADAASVDGKSELVVKIGGFQFRSTVGSDAAYKPGQHQATLLLLTTRGPSKIRVVLATAKIDWSDSRLVGTVEGRIPANKPMASEDFVGQPTGKAEGETSASVTFAGTTASARVAVSAAIGRRSAELEGLSRTVTKVQLHGQSAGGAGHQP